MQNILPTFSWQKYYNSSRDSKSPFFGLKPKSNYENEIYGYFIDPAWQYIGSETLYCNILMVNYDLKYAVIELFGEWNDALHNDIKWLKNTVLDTFIQNEITHFVLITENILQYHGSFSDYYEELYEDTEEGWLCILELPTFLETEFNKFKMQRYFHFGGSLNFSNWRTFKPNDLFSKLNVLVMKRLN